MPRFNEGADAEIPPPPDRLGVRHWGDGLAGPLIASRIQGFNSANADYRDIAVDANGSLQLAANVSVDLGIVDQGAAGAAAWKVTDAAIPAGLTVTSTRLLVDGSGVTQPVSGTVTANQGGAPWSVGGNVAHNAVDAGNPVKLGGYASNGAPVSVADAQRVNGWFSPNGALHVEISRDNSTSGGSAINAWGNGSIDGTQATGPVVIAVPLIRDPSNGIYKSPVGDATNGQWVNVKNIPAVTATLAAETTKVIGTVNISSGQTVGLAAGVAEIGNVKNSGTFAVQASAVVSAPVFTRLSDGAAALIGQKAMAASLPVTIASDQGTLSTSVSNFPANAAQETGGNLAVVGAVVGATSDSLVTGDTAGTDAAKLRGINWLLTQLIADTHQSNQLLFLIWNALTAQQTNPAGALGALG